MNPAGNGSRAGNTSTDQRSPEQGVTTLDEDDRAIAPQPPAHDDDVEPYRDEEE